MLLASSDVLALEPAAKELVASGIPIAVCKAADLSSYVEVWIQRACDGSAGPGSLMTSEVSRTATEGAGEPVCAGSEQRGSAGSGGVPVATSRIGRCVCWLRQLGQNQRIEGR